MNNNKRYKDMQCNIEERKLNLLEKESVIKMEKLKAEADHECLNLDTACMQFKVELICQRVQLFKEGVLQDDIDSILPIVND